MTFTFAPAVRERVGLLIGLAGASGSGKTLSALKIARGLAGGDDTRIAFIDTEGGRGNHYAPARGEQPSETRFGFQHGDLKPPFTPEAYRAAIEAADEAGFEVIVIDSYSHSWDGDGGLQDMHGVIVDEMVSKSRAVANEKGWRFDELAAQDKASIGAWKLPKTRHKRLVSRLLQCRAHLVICMRADEKMRMETVEERGNNGKTYKKTVITAAKDLPVNERWVPIVEKRFPYELTTSFILTPANPGVPVPIKLQEQHRAAVPLDWPIDENVGRALATWARGGTLATPQKQIEAPARTAPARIAGRPAADAPPRTDELSGWDRLCRDARAAANQGSTRLRAFRRSLDARYDRDLDEIGRELEERAAEADARDDVPSDQVAA